MTADRMAMWERPPRWLMALNGAVLVAAVMVAAVGFPSSVDAGFADRLLTAIGARTAGGTVACTIPGDLHVGRHFACHGVDTVGTYTVEVTIVDPQHDFRLQVARAI